MAYVTCQDRPPFPCKVFDANGLEWTHVFAVDTETGDLERYVVEDNGSLTRQTCKVPAPVVLVWQN